MLHPHADAEIHFPCDMMRIATWNVNSIHARLPVVLTWLNETKPDIALLQEIKTPAATFPTMEIEDLGYNIALVGEKSYNGVAILAKQPIEDLTTHLPGDEADNQARYIEAVVGNVRVASIYAPNGQAVGSDKYAYKLQFYERLYAHIQTLLTYEEAFVLGGDYNIAPSDNDVHDPEAWRGQVLCSLPERQQLRKILYLGLTDALRALHPTYTPEGRDLYTWWDYRSNAWIRNAGLRIDHLLLSPQAADRLTAANVDKDARNQDKASDHAPVWCTLK